MTKNDTTTSSLTYNHSENTLPLLSGKVSSIKLSEDNIQMGIDRIEGHPPYISKSVLVKIHKYKSNEKFMNNFGYVRSYKFKEVILHLCFQNKRVDSPSKFFFNLNGQGSISDQLKEVFHYFPDLKYSRITRVDINIDFNIQMKKLLMILQIQNKQLSREYGASNSSISGNIWGKGDEVIRLYSNTSDLTATKTRLELQIRNKKLPNDRSFNGIIKWLKSEDHFKSVQLWEILDTNIKKDKPTKSFFSSLRKYLPFIQFQMSGLTQAKKVSSHPKNFLRTLRQFIKIEKSEISLLKIFRTKVTNSIGVEYD